MTVPAGFYVRRANGTFAEETPCPKASTERNSTGSDAFHCTSGVLEFNGNVWHDGLRESALNGTRKGVVWQQKRGVVVDSKTKFYQCECNKTCCNVHPVTGNVSCAFGSHGLLCSQCIGGHFKQASTKNCVKCGSWAAVEKPMIAVLALPAFVLDVFLWWTIAGKIPCCHGMKDWVAGGACCPLFMSRTVSGSGSRVRLHRIKTFSLVWAAAIPGGICLFKRELHFIWGLQS